MKVLLGLGILLLVCVCTTGQGNSGNGHFCYTCKENDYDKCTPGKEEECKGNSKTHCMSIVKTKKKGDIRIEKMCVNPQSKCCSAGDYCKSSCGTQHCYHCCNTTLCNEQTPPQVVLDTPWDGCDSQEYEDYLDEDDRWEADWGEEGEDECGDGAAATWRACISVFVASVLTARVIM